MLDDATKWVAALRGGLVALPQFLTSGGGRGAVIAFQNATRVKRGVWLSPGYRRDHPELAGLIERITKTSWTQCSRAVFLASAVGVRHIGLMTIAEQAIVNRPNAMTNATGLQFVTKIDVGRSAIGIGKSNHSQIQPCACY